MDQINGVADWRTKRKERRKFIKRVHLKNTNEFLVDTDWGSEYHDSRVVVLFWQKDNKM